AAGAELRPRQLGHRQENLREWFSRAETRATSRLRQDLRSLEGLRIESLAVGHGRPVESANPGRPERCVLLRQRPSLRPQRVLLDGLAPNTATRDERRAGSSNAAHERN